MCCHKEGVTQGLLSTVAKPIEDHPKSDVHSRKTRAAVEGQLALSGPVVLEDMTAAQLMAFLATGSPESAPAASGAISALGPRLIQADLGDVPSAPLQVSRRLLSLLGLASVWLSSRHRGTTMLRRLLQRMMSPTLTGTLSTRSWRKSPIPRPKREVR